METARRVLPAKKSEKGLSQGQMVESFVVLSALGGGVIEDMERLRQDEGLAVVRLRPDPPGVRAERDPCQPVVVAPLDEPINGKRRDLLRRFRRAAFVICRSVSRSLRRTAQVQKVNRTLTCEPPRVPRQPPAGGAQPRGGGGGA